MEVLYQLDIPELVELLSRQTAIYTRMLSEGYTDEEFKECDITIKKIQAEIELRLMLSDLSNGENTNSLDR